MKEKLSSANTVPNISEADHAVDLRSVLVWKIIAEPRCVPAERELYGLYRAVCTLYRLQRNGETSYRELSVLQ